MDFVPEIGCEVEVETYIESEGEAIIRELRLIIQDIKKKQERQRQDLEKLISEQCSSSTYPL